MFRLPSVAAVVGAALLATAAPAALAAQPAVTLQAPALATAPAAPAPSAVRADTAIGRVAGPLAAQAAFPSTLRASTAVATVQNDARLGMGRNLSMIGVGAAAIVAGLLVGDGLGTGIAIGGGALALYGLYQFLR